MLAGETLDFGERALERSLPGDKRDLLPGVKIFIPAARKKEDGTLEADSIAAGRDGLPPPM